MLRHHVGETFSAMVVEVSEKDPTTGEVMVSDPAVEARVRSSDGTPLPLGTDVTVRLVEADPATGRCSSSSDRRWLRSERSERLETTTLNPRMS